MPRRSNLFQETVAIVHRHLAGDAELEESAMLVQRTTGEEREVDVVLRSAVAGHEVVVSVEARSTARKADLPWVESMLGKHADLPTSKLILVSEAGFTGPAKRLAEAKGVVPVAPRDLEGDHPGRRLIEALNQVSLRELTGEITEGTMYVLRPNGQRMRVNDVPLNINIYMDDGEYLTMLFQLFEAERTADAEFVRFQAELPPGEEQQFKMALAPTLADPLWHLPGGLTASHIYARWEEVDPPEMQVIEKFELTAKAVVREAPTIEMKTRQLDKIGYSYGATTLGGKKALVVITADETGGKITVRASP